MKLLNMFYPLSLMILVFGIPRSQSFVISEDSEVDLTEEDRNPEDSNKFFKDISTQQLAEDDALVKHIVADATENEDLLKEMEAEFLSTVLRLVGNGELYKDARIDAITVALRSAFLATTGSVDHEYINQVLRSIREKDEQKQPQSEESDANILSPSVKDFNIQDLESVDASTSTSTAPHTRGWRKGGKDYDN